MRESARNQGGFWAQTHRGRPQTTSTRVYAGGELQGSPVCLSSRTGYFLDPTEWPKGSQSSSEVWTEPRPRPSFSLFPLAARPPFPRDSRHEREATGAVSLSVVVAAVAAPAGGGPGPASGRRFLPARPGARQLLRGREEDRRVQGGCGPADNTPLTLPWGEPGSEGKGASLGFSRQEYWRRLPFPSPGIFLPQGWNTHLLSLLYWQVGSL